MILSKLNIKHADDRSDLIAILVTAGYKVSMETIPAAPYTLDSPTYLVVVEDIEEATP